MDVVMDAEEADEAAEEDAAIALLLVPAVPEELLDEAAEDVVDADDEITEDADDAADVEFVCADDEALAAAPDVDDPEDAEVEPVAETQAPATTTRNRRGVAR